MKFTETMGQFHHRCRTGAANRPLKTFREIAEMLGVTERAMLGHMKRADAPKPKMVHKNRSTGRNSWYDPAEVRAWWDAIKKEA